MKVRMLVYEDNHVVYKSSWVDAGKMVIVDLLEFMKGFEDRVEFEFAL